MQTTPATGRDERVTTLSNNPPRVNTIKGPPPAPRHLGPAVAAQQAAEREEARLKREEEIAQIPPPAMARVLADKANVACKMPDNAATFRTNLRAGKVITSREYDFDDLRSQGVKLGDVSEETIEVATDYDTNGNKALVSVPAMLKALHDAGFELRPRADGSAVEVAAPAPPSIELETMRARVAELEKMLAGDKVDAKPKGR
jgi:hypothetical protein